MKKLRQPIQGLETTLLMMVAVAVLFFLVSPHLSLSEGPSLPRSGPESLAPRGDAMQLPSSLPPEVVQGLEKQRKTNRQALAQTHASQCDLFADYLSNHAGTALQERTVAAVKRLQRQNNC